MQYLPALTGLRAVACLMVVGFHAKLPGLSGGFVGVDMFFVLSGFLTASMLAQADLSRPIPAVLQFMTRRAARIVPLTVLVASCVTAALLWTGQTDALTTELLPAIGFFANITLSDGNMPKFMVHSWSLAAEMQFYLVAALLMLLLTRLPSWAGLAVFTGLYLGLSLMTYLAFQLDWGWHRIYFAPDLRASGLFLGAAVALLPARVAASCARLGWVALAACLLSAHAGTYKSALSHITWKPITELATAVLILNLLQARHGALLALLSHPSVERIGLWSFGLYLWHYPIARVLRASYDGSTTFALTLLISVPLAALTFRLVEQRFSASQILRAKPRYSALPGWNGARS